EGVEGVAKAKKVRKMIWCLAEAHRAMKRRLWLTDGIVSTAIFQDARKGKLTIRFTAVDVDLYHKVMASIEAYTSDAAADEIRAGFMLAGQTVRADAAKVMPNLRIVTRDKPHATRRLASRGWKADPFLDDVQGMFVWNEQSPVRLIQFSEVFSAWSQANVQKIEPHLKAANPHQGCKDLHFAPHRFDSASKPMSRCTIYFPALVATMDQIVASRKGNAEAVAASTFLGWLDDEKALQLAMLADAGDELSDLLRLLDYEGFPLEDLSFNLSAFLERLNYLFVGWGGQAPACLDGGYTKHMIDLLRNPLSIPVAGRSKVGSCSGVSLAAQARCLARMGNWVVVATETLRAEFPWFEVVQAWSVFNVVERDRDAGHHSLRARRAQRLEQLQRLVTAFGLQADPEHLDDQLQGLRHVALRVAAEEHLESRDAWVRAVTIARRTRMAGSMGCGKDLLSLLVRFWASGASTSGVEQSFAQIVGCSGPKLCMGMGALEDRMDILDLELIDEDSVINLAMQLWREHYGCSRTSGARPKRSDTGGTRQKNQGDLPTEFAFSKERRAAVTEALSSLPTQDVGAITDTAGARCMATWTDSHDKEIKFANEKRIKRIAEETWAGRDQALSSATDDDLAVVVATLERKVKTDKAYVAQCAKRRRLQQGPTPRSVDDSAVYVEAGLRTIDLDNFTGVCASKQLQHVVYAKDASLFVVKDIANISATVKWNAALCGGTICEWPFVQKGIGPSLALHAGLASRRLLFMTGVFVAAQPRLAETILVRMGTFPNAKWRITENQAWFTTRSRAEPSIAVALIATGENADTVMPDVRQAFTSAEALDFFYRVDDLSSTIGACSR
ncbi:unnamed protein product, partial [Prorocentrum cordatum]